MLGGGGQREKNWDNCNSMINKIFFKNTGPFNIEKVRERVQVSMTRTRAIEDCVGRATLQELALETQPALGTPQREI